MFAAEDGAAVAQSAGWFLEHAWLIPLIPAIAFFLIIGFGKRLSATGSGKDSLEGAGEWPCSALNLWTISAPFSPRKFA